MISKYQLPLKVSEPNGKRVIATITQMDGKTNKFELPFIRALSNDKKMKKHSGKFVAFYQRARHKDFVEKTTKYLESLFLKELSDEDPDTSQHSGNKSRRAEKQVDSSAVGISERSSDSSIHNS
jgi:hypothetical protein